MADNQDSCEWMNVSSGTSSPGITGQRAVKRLLFQWNLCQPVPTGLSPLATSGISFLSSNQQHEGIQITNSNQQPSLRLTSSTTSCQLSNAALPKVSQKLIYNF